jgi:biopolymer transport protein ExbD
LVIFIITAPLLASAIRLDLPDLKAAPVGSGSAIKLAIEADGTLRWEGSIVGPAELGARLTQAAGRQPQPELHLLADQAARYDAIARVMAAAQQAGILKMGFVTDPPPAAAAAAETPASSATSVNPPAASTPPSPTASPTASPAASPAPAAAPAPAPAPAAAPAR